MFKKIIITLFSIIGLAVVIYITITATTYSLTHDLALKIYKEVQEDQDFDPFVRYQTKIGKRIYTEVKDDYYLAIYHVVVEDAYDYKNQLLIIIDATDEVDHAQNRADQNDQMAVRLYIDSELEHHTKTDDPYKDVALSYGLKDEVLGFVYVGFTIEENETDLNVEILDYNGLTLLNRDFEFMYTTFDPTSGAPEGFFPGYSVKEISEMVNLDQELTTQVSINILLYLVLVIFGLGTYYFIRKYVKHKNE